MGHQTRITSQLQQWAQGIRHTDKRMGTGHQAQADKSMGIGYDEVIRVEGSKGMTQAWAQGIRHKLIRAWA